MVKDRLGSWFPGWNFETLDARGCYGGFAIGWNESYVKVLNIWGLESVLGLEFKELDLEVSFTVFNIYGPYLNGIPF